MTLLNYRLTADHGKRIVNLRYCPRSILRASAPVYSSSSRSHFSSSPTAEPKDENSQPAENSQSSSTSSFNSDAISRLKGRGSQPSQQPPRQGSSSSQPLHYKTTSRVDLSEIRKSLSKFSRQSDAPPQPSGVQDPPVEPPSQELHMNRSQNDVSADKSASARSALDNIRQQLQSKYKASDDSQRQNPSTFSQSNRTNSIKLKPKEGSQSFNATRSSAIGGMSERLPESLFGKDIKRPKKADDDNTLVKVYSDNELGEKLRQLRSNGVNQGKNWFSLSELNERLIKLRELEQQEQAKEKASKVASFDSLLDTLQQVQDSDYDKKLNNQGVGLSDQTRKLPAFMAAPPKEKLVEKYFHPDNLSSAQKLKIELKAVRERFKMSDSDCGSTRVQIAQLTTEINHLSKVLHKKDKHNKRGLQAKVQMRRKLLKYLRRTDWDSYCFILTELGLRDNPGYNRRY